MVVHLRFLQGYTCINKEHMTCQEEAYPFYEKGVHCFDDVYTYLSTWCKKENTEEDDIIVYQDKLHTPVTGFRRAFTSHVVARDPVTDKMIFLAGTYAMSDYHDSYEEVLRDAAHKYCQLWKINV